MSLSRPDSQGGTSLPGRTKVLLLKACDDQLAGRLREAAEGFAAVIDEGNDETHRPVVAEALRRLAVLHHLRSEPQAAHDYAQQSLQLAHSIPDEVLAAEALNCLAGFASEAGDIPKARLLYLDALELARCNPSITGRVEQNLGILANIQGDLENAIAHYQRALASYGTAQDEQGCAMVYHNLGMLCSDRRAWEDAYHNFTRCLQLARSVGDLHLEAKCILNRCEVYLAQERYEESRQELLKALDIFDRLDSRGDKAAAYRMLGVAYRQTGRMALAESRLRSAVEIAVSAGIPLDEAEAHLELARLYHRTSRTPHALRHVRDARNLFERLGAQAELSVVKELEQQLAG